MTTIRRLLRLRRAGQHRQLAGPGHVAGPRAAAIPLEEGSYVDDEVDGGSTADTTSTGDRAT
ncbi:hypothetical protein [Amycolatopsis aidingensis]|uniref:hypothetical protein n=1 Tax=Amycolatopsis aidingensis TaxID=2842453 RepID=UPI001C0C5E13|nr:hypothetical protein [Amycolatopsis aidingensis]